MNKRFIFIYTILISAICCGGNSQAAGDSFVKDLQALTANPHRLPGRADGSLAAGKYVLGRLKEIGFKDSDIFIQTFPVVQPIPTQCELAANGKTYPIYAARPNLIQAAITPAEGITAKTIYAAKGDLPAYGKNRPTDKIIVLDFDCDQNWVSAFAFGARAVLFVGPKDGAAADAKAYHHANMPANLPRFYVPYDTANELDLTNGDRKGEVTIYSACQWKELRGCNVIAVLRGTNPIHSKDAPAQAVVLAAPLDSYSEVPELSPGARDAANCAALLQIAETLKKNPPRRDVIFCFFDGQSANHLGARAFYGALYRRLRDSKLAQLTIDDRLKDLTAEKEYFTQLLNVLNQEDLMSEKTSEMKYYDETLRMLREEARTLDNSVIEEIQPKRITRHDKDAELEQASKIADSPDSSADQKAGAKQKIDRLKDEMKALDDEITALKARSDGWNKVQADLHYRNVEANSSEYFNRLLTIGRGICQRRLAEVAQSAEEAAVSKKLLEALGPKRNQIVLHLSINLGDARSRWTFIHGDDSAPLDTDTAGNYTSLFKTINETAGKLSDKLSGFDNRAITQNYDNRIFAPAKFVDSGAIARLFAVWNISTMTVMDYLPRQGLPTDTVSALDVKTVAEQANEVAICLRKLLDENGLSQLSKSRADVRYGEATWSTANRKSNGGMIKLGGVGGALRARPVRDAIVAVLHNKSWAGMAINNVAPGFTEPIFAKTNVNGIFEIGPYSTTYYKNSDYSIIAALFDYAESDRKDLSRGLISCISSSDTAVATNEPTKSSTIIFATRYMTLVGYGFDRGSETSLAMRALSTAQFPKERHLIAEWSNIISIFASSDAKGLKLFNKAGIVALNNANTRQDYQGKGLSLDDPFRHVPNEPMTAHDLTTLNEARLDLLRAVRIHQDSLEALTGIVKDLMASAQAGKDRSFDWYFGTLETAAAYSRLVYIPLKKVLNDLVTAVVLLLLLAMPFAYALERLLIGTPHIYRQIGWFAIFFLATFALLYNVNPAFKIASTPIIIFLAFAIILLSTLVIFIMVRKLQTEVRRMQGLATTVHSADVSRLSTMTAAVNMGISTMRRRPLRTLLTAITVVLLTFTILTFASFGSSWGIWLTYEGSTSGGPPHVFVRHQLWSPIGDGVFSTVRGFLSRDAQVVPRYWVSPTAQQVKDATAAGQNLEKLLATGNCSRIIPVAAAIGLDIADLKDEKGHIHNEQMADLFESSAQIDLLADNGIFLTEAVSKELNLTPADIGKAEVLLAGWKFIYGGVVKDQLAIFKSLEGSDILPVDYESSLGDTLDTFTKSISTTTTTLTETPDIQSAQFVPYNVDKVVIISPAMAKKLNGGVRSINVYPAPEKIESIREMADAVARITQLPTYVGDQGGVHRMIFTSLAKASGWKDLLIPVILGGLIIFATMLGSVSDREREIYTFSSLGLAPPHVASLFFAEASMYAVIGGMGGYLLGQVVARLFAFLSAQFGWSVPPMNYSSTNAIVTILIVMGTVLVSTIYPAMKASRSANPGIQRTWQIPSPKGNLYDLVFPFTVSSYDITGVVSFLKEHFENYTDTSLGVFATTSCGIFRQSSNDMLGFEATVALAPFDLGVNQKFAMLSQPSDIEGINEVRILIYRLSGAQGDWQRSNRVFINDLRKQLLIWRALPHEVMDKYRDKTHSAWNDLPVKQVDGLSIGGPE